MITVAISPYRFYVSWTNDYITHIGSNYALLMQLGYLSNYPLSNGQLGLTPTYWVISL
jgi:hypothetical protein